MGFFNRKSKSDGGRSAATGASVSTGGWVLRGGRICSFSADPSWADGVRAGRPKVARVGHSLTVELASWLG